MSDLAPFVAATIHDKVVLDLLEENKKLKEQIRFHHKVEITGPKGSPVYARADFGTDGTYSQDNVDLWEVTIPTQQQKSDDVQVCRFVNLLDVEIRIGGVVNKSFRKDTIAAYVVEDDTLTIAFTEPSSEEPCAWFDLKVADWDNDRWSRVFEDEGADAEDSFEIIEFASEESPDAIVTFCHFITTVDSMKGMIGTLPQAHDKELQKRVEENRFYQDLRDRVQDFVEFNWDDTSDQQMDDPLLESMIAILCRTGNVQDPSSLDEILRELLFANHDVLKEISDLLGFEAPPSASSS